MIADSSAQLSRRQLLSAAGLLFAGLGRSSASAAGLLPPTPDCRDPDEPTPPTGPGPLFKPGSPERSSLVEPRLGGERLVLAGRVLSTRCAAVPGALLDFWQADPQGRYDTEGFTLRGHQFAGADGLYRLETLVPGEYPGRARHIHVRLQAPGGRLLTTQLFFPGEKRNETDFIFRPELLVRATAGPDARLAVFDFVLDLA
jgi:protocatechuate 3,4-dioxygenase beta subunit